MRNLFWLGTLAALIFTATLPAAVGVNHDDPCVNQAVNGVGDSPNVWSGARRLSAAALGAAGCTTESIAPGNTCGAVPDPGDFFYTDIPLGKTLATVTFTVGATLFSFCGGTFIDIGLEMYVLRAGSFIPGEVMNAASGPIDSLGPGTLVCSADAIVGSGAETCSATIASNAGGDRVFFHKIRVAGTGANTLKVTVV